MEEKVFFKGKHGNICGILNEIKDSKEIVIICHGFSSHKNTSPPIFAKLLDSIKISSLRIDLDNQGESDLDFETGVCVKNYVDQIKSTYEYCKKLGYEEVSLLGTSFGGVCVGVAAHELTKENKKIKRICFRCTVIDNSTALRWEFGSEKFNEMMNSGIYNYYSKKKDQWFKVDFVQYFEKSQYSLFDYKDTLTMPMCCIQGDIDDEVDPNEVIKFCKEFDNCELRLIKGAKHSLAVNGDFTKSQQALVDFFSEEV